MRAVIVRGRKGAEARYQAASAPPTPLLRGKGYRDMPDRPRGYGKLSVVIATYGQWGLTEQCLDSIQKDVPAAEVIVVDNGSPDDTVVQVLRRLANHEGLRLIENKANLGCAAAWNIGLRAARGDVLCILNNDTIIHPGGLKAIAAGAHRAGIAAWVGGSLAPDMSFLDYTANPDDATYPDGCCLAFRRDVWERVGEFDPDYGLGYCEDSDWGLRAALCGYTWELFPNALSHYGHRTSDTIAGMNDLHRRNRALLKARYGSLGAGERILVRRGGALGDVIMATPALASLRLAQPLARVHLQCDASIADFLAGTPLADSLGPDGPDWEPTRAYDLDRAYEDNDYAGHWRHPAYAFADVLGVPLRATRYLLPETPELDEWAAETLPQADAVALVPRSAFRPKANWGERKWAELAQAMPDQRFVVLDAERRPALEVDRKPYKGPSLWDQPNVIDLTGKTPSSRHGLALLRRAVGCVSVDTGFFHVAAGLDLPTVGLIGGVAGWARAPLAGRCRILQGEQLCYPCDFALKCERPRGLDHCLAGYSGKRVAAVLESLLEPGELKQVRKA